MPSPSKSHSTKSDHSAIVAETVQLTSEQENILDSRGVSLVISAGAGCGKTFILTERFLADLDRHGDLKSLYQRVAITFTERAAREMRDRIRKSVKKRIRSRETERTEFWQSILQGLDSARINTIHSFCATILRAHAIETGLDPHFGLLDEQTTGSMLQKAVTSTLHQSLIDQDEHAAHLVLHYGLEQTGGILHKLVTQRHRGSWNKFLDLKPQMLIDAWMNQFRERFIPERVKEFQQSSIVRTCVNLLQENEPTHPVMQQRRAALLELHQRNEAVTDPAAYFGSIAENAVVRGGGGANAWSSADIYERVRNSFEKLRAEVKKISALLNIDDTGLNDHATLSLAAAHLAARVDAEYAEIKKRQSLLDFDDLLLKTRDLLSQNDSVREKLRRGIDLLMIDEFQDTDPLQAEIVRHLCGDQIRDGKLFLVGDAKQSIYRFRRADPAVFHQFREEMKPEGRLPLSTNFRSQPDILKFVNHVFRNEMGAEYIPLTPSDNQQYSPPPVIEFLLAAPEWDHDTSPANNDATLVVEHNTSDANAADTQSTDETSEEKQTADRCREREARWIARRIRSLLEDQQPRVRQKNKATGEMELRPIEPGDIVILFRSLSKVGVYEEELRKCGLDYYLVGGRAFYAQQEIHDVVNLLKFIDNTEDLVSLVGILRSPFFNLTDDTLLALANAPKKWEAFLDTESLPAGLPDDQMARVNRARGVLRRLIDIKDRVSLVELLNLAIELTGYDASLLHEFLGKRKLANLKKLIALVRTFDQTGLFTLKEIVQRLNTAIEDETDEEFAALHAEEAKIIRLMTIHQSKGLEFPVVIVANMNWDFRGGPGGANFHPEFGPLLPNKTQVVELDKSIAQEMHSFFERKADQEELIRLLYVAMTRAADHLVLSAGLTDWRGADGKLSPWLQLLARHFDLTTGLPVIDPLLGSMTRKDGSAILNEGPLDPALIPQILVHRSIPNPRSLDQEERKRVHVSKFNEEVARVSPENLPPLFGAVTNTPPETATYSVTQIEEAFQHLRESDADDTFSLLSPMESSISHDIDDSKPTRRRRVSANDHEQVAGDAESDISSAELGTLVHLVLEHADLSRDEIATDALNRIFEMRLPRPPQELIDAAKRRLLPFLDSSSWHTLRRSRSCRRELDFLLTWPNANGEQDKHDLIKGKIDCLYETENGQWVIRDYKTKPWNDVVPRDDDSRYRIQLGLYALAFERMFGAWPDRIELVYLGRTVECQTFVPRPEAIDRFEHYISECLVSLRRPVE